MTPHQSIYAALVLAALLVLGACFTGCTTSTPTGAAPTPAATVQPSETGASPVSTMVAPTSPPGPKVKLLLATTTSLYDTGLLDYLKPKFEEQYNAELLITSQGTGKAIELAKRGDADLLMVHSPSQETTYLEGGNGLNPRCFAYNYFIIVGPASDPAGIKGMTPEAAFIQIRSMGLKNTPGVAFASRGDNSGTHTAEKSIWSVAKLNYTKDIQKSGNWYIEAGRGMGETLQLASEKQAYTLTDEGTYLAYKGNLDLVPLVEKGDALLNRYTVMTVYNTKQPLDKIEMSNNFVNFMISTQTQADIAAFGVDKYGKGLFTPMNGNCTQFKCDCTKPATGIKPLTVFYAGSLESPFKKLEALYETDHARIDLQGFGGPSGTMIEKITKQGSKADVLASADAYLIPQMMMPTYADFYLTFAKNEMVLVYTNASDYAGEITQDNWYEVVNRPGVTFAISDPNTDPAGYRGVMAVQLAERVYGTDTIFSSLIGSHSTITRTFADGIYLIDVTKPNPDNTKFFIGKSGPDVVSMVKDGKADYAIEYSSVAIQNKLPYLDLPEGMDLSQESMADKYATVKVKRLSGTTTSTEKGTPIIYGITVPKTAMTPDQGIEFVKLVIGPAGQQILSEDGQTPIVPAQAYGNVPAELQDMVVMGS